jgi:hypothetical protein
MCPLDVPTPKKLALRSPRLELVLRTVLPSTLLLNGEQIR